MSLDWCGCTNDLYQSARSISNLVSLIPSTTFKAFEASTTSYLQLYSFWTGFKLKSTSLSSTLFFVSSVQTCWRSSSLLKARVSISRPGSMTTLLIWLWERWTCRRLPLPSQSKKSILTNQLLVAENSVRNSRPSRVKLRRPKLFRDRYSMQLKGGEKWWIGFLMTSTLLYSYSVGSNSLGAAVPTSFGFLTYYQGIKVLQAIDLSSVTGSKFLDDPSRFSLLLCRFKIFFLVVAQGTDPRFLRLKLPLLVLESAGLVVFAKYS